MIISHDHSETVTCVCVSERERESERESAFLAAPLARVHQVLHPPPLFQGLSALADPGPIQQMRDGSLPAPNPPPPPRVRRIS